MQMIRRTQLLIVAAATSCLLVGCGGDGPAVKTTTQTQANQDDPNTGMQAVIERQRPAGTTPEERYDTAVTMQEDGVGDEALAEFERIIESNPNFTLAYLRAGDIYMEREDYVRAEARFARAAQLEPRNFEAQFKHGLALQLLDRVHASVRAYLRALSIRPNDFEANLNLGTAYLELREPQQALPFSQRAVAANANSGPARVNLGAVYAAMDMHEAAVIEFQQAAELMELTPELLLNLGESLGKIDRYAEMVATLDQLILIEPSAIAFERRGSGLFRLRRYDESLEAFKAAIEMDEVHFPAYNGVAVCLLNQYLWSNKEDTSALNGAVDALRSSLQIERQQPRIVELLRRYG